MSKLIAEYQFVYPVPSADGSELIVSAPLGGENSEIINLRTGIISDMHTN